MAVRFREGRRLPWQTYWNNPFTGKRESESFLTEMDAKKHDSLIKHRLRYERESFKQEDNDKTENATTLEMVYTAFVSEKKPKESVLKSQIGALKAVVHFIGTTIISEITAERLQEAYDIMVAKGLWKNASLNTYFSRLQSILNWAADRGWCEKVKFPSRKKYDGERLMPPTPDELETIMAHASPHIQRVCIIGSQFGVRIGPSELLKLTWEHVDFHRKVLRVPAAEKNKHCVWREVPIKENLLPILKQWKEEDSKYEDCPIIHIDGKPLRKMHAAWKGALRRAGITRRIRLYDLRHAFATEAIANGADIGTVASLMGHSDATMILRHYQFVTDKQKLHAIEALPDVNYVPSTMCPTFTRQDKVKNLNFLR